MFFDPAPVLFYELLDQSVGGAQGSTNKHRPVRFYKEGKCLALTANDPMYGDMSHALDYICERLRRAQL